MTGAYAAAAAADPFDRAASFLTCLIDSLSRPEAPLLPHERVEEDAEQAARELARLLLQGHMDLRARQEEAELSALDTGGRARLAAGRTRLEKGHQRQLATVVGSVTITRGALRAPGLPNCYPADQALGLPRERHSLGLRRLVVLEAARGSYDSTLEAIERRCGTRAVGKRQAERLVRAAAVDIAAFYAARTPAPAAGTTLLVLSVERVKLYVQQARPKIAEELGHTPRELARLHRRFEVVPGAQAQVDWGDEGGILAHVGIPKVYSFHMVLSYSRDPFCCFTTSQNLAAFWECHRRAFAHYGGVPGVIVYDRTKTVVRRHVAPGEVVPLHPEAVAFAGHYDFDIDVLAAYRPTGKGRVERQVTIVRDHVLAGRAFSGLDDLDGAFMAWVPQRRARTHRTHGEVPPLLRLGTPRVCDPELLMTSTTSLTR